MIKSVLKADTVVVVNLCLAVYLVVFPVGKDPVAVSVDFIQALGTWHDDSCLFEYFNFLRGLLR